eukprot:TRINITY_DN7086_c0_g1_i11.p1 TRINITY_DN7086_c0_g1~~TRINITY_DN7086_c0_g1_i11.p1  ORF type:complete len:238 (+),score=-7.75 TRINITY_DN7086_c0_g1_i11:389-1102(+)
MQVSQKNPSFLVRFLNFPTQTIQFMIAIEYHHEDSLTFNTQNKAWVIFVFYDLFLSRNIVMCMQLEDSIPTRQNMYTALHMISRNNLYLMQFILFLIMKLARSTKDRKEKSLNIDYCCISILLIGEDFLQSQITFFQFLQQTSIFPNSQIMFELYDFLTIDCLMFYIFVVICFLNFYYLHLQQYIQTVAGDYCGNDYTPCCLYIGVYIIFNQNFCFYNNAQKSIYSFFQQRRKLISN